MTTPATTPATTSSTTPLFPASLIPPLPLPAGYKIRPLQRGDYGRGFLDALRVLTAVGDIPQAAWEARYDWMAAHNEEYFVVCVEDENGLVVGVGSLVVERKL